MARGRPPRRQAEVRERILDAAREIVSREGIQGLSIRKITRAVDYSPAIVYHYFKDKDEIIETLVREGYQRILSAIGAVERNADEPEAEIAQAFTNYIRAALRYPEEYKAFILNTDPEVLERTALLRRGISRERETLQVLCRNLERGVKQGRYAPWDTELTAQILWTSSFGLLLKLIIEKNIPQEQVDRLLEHHFTVLFHGLLRRGAGDVPYRGLGGRDGANEIRGEE